jgi:hypothetical protein
MVDGPAYRYMQIMATIFTFNTRYDGSKHSSPYNDLVAICRARSVLLLSSGHVV